MKGSKENKIIKYLFDSSYGVGIAGIVLLLILAFFGPQLIFGIQDQYQMDRAWQGARNSLDMEALYQSYEGIRERLITFADIRSESEMDVAGTEYEADMEFYTMMDMVLGTDYIYILAEYGGMPGLAAMTERRYTVNKWKKYIFYSDDYEINSTTVVISAWYSEIETYDGEKIQLLVDTETYELYYIRVDDYGSLADVVFDSEVTIVTEWEKQKWKNVYQTFPVGMEWILFSCWYDYYKAGESQSQSFEEYMIDPTYAQKKGLDEIMVSGKKYADERFYMVEYSMQLPYWDNFLKCELLYSDYYDMNDSYIISAGIVQIAELIPEFQKN